MTMKKFLFPCLAVLAFGTVACGDSDYDDDDLDLDNDVVAVDAPDAYVVAEDDPAYVSASAIDAEDADYGDDDDNATVSSTVSPGSDRAAEPVRSTARSGAYTTGGYDSERANEAYYMSGGESIPNYKGGAYWNGIPVNMLDGWGDFGAEPGNPNTPMDMNVSDDADYDYED